MSEEDKTDTASPVAEPTGQSIRVRFIPHASTTYVGATLNGESAMTDADRIAQLTAERDSARAMVGAELQGLEQQKAEAIRRWQTACAERDSARRERDEAVRGAADWRALLDTAEKIRDEPQKYAAWCNEEMATMRDVLRAEHKACVELREQLAAAQRERDVWRSDADDAAEHETSAIRRAEMAERERDEWRRSCLDMKDRVDLMQERIADLRRLAEEK